MAKESKYRPYLTVEQINYLYSLLSSKPQDVTKLDTHLELQQCFKLLHFKVNEGLSTPSYMANIKVDLETSIGITLEEKKEAAWNKYSTAVTQGSLSPQELAYAELYMYEHNLMRVDEEAYFEANGTLEGYTNTGEQDE